MKENDTTTGSSGFSHWLGRFHVHGVFWYRFHQWGVRVVPQFLLAPLIALFTAVFFLVLPRARRAIASNLAVVLGPCGWWETQRRIFRNLWNFAWCLTERYESLGTDREVQPTFEGRENWWEVDRKPPGFILLTAHIGHWEMGSMLPMEDSKRQVHVVREEEVDPRSQEFLEELLSRKGGQRYSMHFAAHKNPSLGPKLLFALRRGDIVALQGDRPPSDGQSVEIELFNRPFTVPIGPAAVGRAAEVVVLPVFMFRMGRLQSRVIFRPAIKIPKTADREADLLYTHRRMAEEIEWAIRQSPYQWFCFREMWPEQSSP